MGCGSYLEREGEGLDCGLQVWKRIQPRGGVEVRAMGQKLIWVSEAGIQGAQLDLRKHSPPGS